MLSENNRHLYEKFFQYNAEYYIDQIESFEKRKRYSFSIAAFFLGFIWMAYRKMYFYIIVALSALLLLNGILQLLLGFQVITAESFDAFFIIVRFLFMITLGAISNRIYINKGHRYIKKAHEKKDNFKVDKFLKNTGGTSWILAITMLAFLFFIVVLASLTSPEVINY